MDKQQHIAGLIYRHQRGTLDPEGRQELDRWLEKDPGNRMILERTGDREQQLEKLKVYRMFDQERVQDRLDEELFGKRTIRLNTMTLLRYAAAIILPLLVLGGAAWWFLGRPETDTMALIDANVQPGHQQAILVLSDGSRIELDPSQSIDAMAEGDATIIHADQELRYETPAGRKVKSAMVYNRLVTPQGGSFTLSLADGSRVWLNAGSSLRFPVSFHDSTRQVFLEGEAYFQVRPGSEPFVVHSADMQTRVLGTSFNVSAYVDDAFIRTTLVEGRVQVILEAEEDTPEQSVVLTPDQQAAFQKDRKELHVDEVDASGFVSWTKGRIEFHNENLEQVMKRLSRWYDFEYEFADEAAMSLRFSARLDRTAPLSEILDMLTLTTEVSFEYKGKRIMIH